MPVLDSRFIETGRDATHHLMVELFSLDDVGQCYDLALEETGRIATTLGRHINDEVQYARRWACLAALGRSGEAEQAWAMCARLTANDPPRSATAWRPKRWPTPTPW